MTANNNIPYKGVIAGAGFVIMTLFATQKVTAQSNDQNYIAIKTVRISGVTNEAALRAVATDKQKVQINIQYADGLGRLIQSIQKEASPLGNDIVKFSTYDNFGREPLQYLPFVPTTGTKGSYRSSPATAASSFYATPPVGVVQIPSTEVVYAETKLEDSPLGRPLEQGAPGLNWKIGGGHTITTNNGVNVAADGVKMWQVNSSGGASYSATYSVGTLIKTTLIDENQNNNAVIEFKDMDGHVVCRKVQNGVGVYLTTDYIYDDNEHLSYVIPPLPTASGTNPAVGIPTSFTESDDVFLNFFYAYHYDGLDRLTEKKLPGQGWQYMVYNNRDQVILSQDANQKLRNIWIVIKYDGLARTVISGEYYNISDSRASLQTLSDNNQTNLEEKFTNGATFYGYTHLSWPDISTGTNNKVLTVSYFDNYSVIFNSVNPNNTIYSEPAYAVDSLENFPNGLPVASLTNVLGTGNYLFAVMQYDKNGRLVKTIRQHYQGGSYAVDKYDSQNNQYSFQGLPLKNARMHYLSGVTSPKVIINGWYTYDNANRQILTKQQVNTPAYTGNIITLSKQDYNEIGQVSTKHLYSYNQTAIPPNSSYLQHVNYSYNARGWLTKINDPTSLIDAEFPSTFDIFAEQLDYDQSTNGYATTLQYNGNISSIRYQTKVPASITGSVPQIQRGYIYNYDAVNRLTSAAYRAAGLPDNTLSESISYDELGNILTLSRRNGSATAFSNNMNYSYTSAGVRGNQLKSITDNGTVSESQATTYTTDLMGNAFGDTKKGISGMTYNNLNLPSVITLANKTIYYTYDASGRKLQKIVKNGSGTVVDDRSYIDGIEYSGNNIEFVPSAEGRVIAPTGSNLDYQLEMQVKDHLGNVRAAFKDLNFDGILTSNEIIQMAEYYPFGRESYSFVSGTQQRYKYNGKELQDDLNQYDYGARFYDPVIGRWTTPDPLAEISRRWSVYNYTEDNPIRYIDPDGMWTEDLNGIHSENPEEAQAFFEQVQHQPKPKQHRSDIKQHPIVAKRDATSRTGPNAYQLAMHLGAVMTAAKANQGFSVAAYKSGTNVSEFKAMNAKGFVRVSAVGKTDIEGRWLMKAQDIQGLTPEQIQAKFALPEVPDRVADADIPNGTVLRSGTAGANKWGPGGGAQYEVMKGRVGFGNVRSLEPIVPPMIEAVPVEPIEPIEPVTPEIIP